MGARKSKSYFHLQSRPYNCLHQRRLLKLKVIMRKASPQWIGTFLGKLTDHSENGAIETPPNRKIGRHATGPNVDKPIFGGRTMVLKGGDSSESASEDDIAPVSSARRVRAAPVVFSSDEGSGPPTPTTPITPRKRLRPHQGLHPRPTTLSEESDTDVPTQGRNPRSKPPQFEKSVVISDDSEDSSSEDEAISPARRRRSKVHLGSEHTKQRSEGEDTDDLDGEVADLNDIGGSQLSK